MKCHLINEVYRIKCVNYPFIVLNYNVILTIKFWTFIRRDSLVIFMLESNEGSHLPRV